MQSCMARRQFADGGLAGCDGVEGCTLRCTRSYRRQISSFGTWVNKHQAATLDAAHQPAGKEQCMSQIAIDFILMDEGERCRRNL